MSILPLIEISIANLFGFECAMGKNDYNFVILSINELFHCNGDLNDQYNLLNILYF